MNYQESMAGLDQIFDALFRQQQQPMSVEVDEMQQGNQSIESQMKKIMAMGENPFFTGMDAMDSIDAATSEDSESVAAAPRGRAWR